MINLALYLAIGLGMYIGMYLNNPMSFTNASAASLLRGVLLCWILWPIGLITKLIVIFMEPIEKTIHRKHAIIKIASSLWGKTIPTDAYKLADMMISEVRQVGLINEEILIEDKD